MNKKIEDDFFVFGMGPLLCCNRAVASVVGTDAAILFNYFLTGLDCKCECYKFPNYFRSDVDQPIVISGHIWVPIFIEKIIVFMGIFTLNEIQELIDILENNGFIKVISLDNVAILTTYHEKHTQEYHEEERNLHLEQTSSITTSRKKRALSKNA